MSWKRALTKLRGAAATTPLPESFLFGVASSDHQCEAYDPEREDIRDVWERRLGLTRRGQATDFEHRYKEDIELARSLGGCRNTQAFRLSLAWSRLEPSPRQFDEATFEYYRALIAAVRAAGMEPIVTLHHFTWPVHVERRGGMIADAFPARFARYVAEVVCRLGRDVRYWITFNEPNQLILGYIKPWWVSDYFAPPGLPEGATLDDQMVAVSKLIRNLFVAHTIARDIIRRANPDAQVGANPVTLGLPDWLQRWINRNATQIHNREDLFRQGRRLAERALPERGDVDVVLAMLTRTPERARQVMFSEAYFVAGQRLLVKAGHAATGVQDLTGKAVAVVRSSTAEQSIRTLLPEAQAHVVGDYSAALRALDRGQAAALLADDTILRGLAAQHPAQYRLIGERLTHEPYAAAVSLGNGELLDLVDLVVRRFTDSGAWVSSCARHLGWPVPERPRSTVRALTFSGGSELVRVAAQRIGGSERPLPLASRGTALRRIQDRGYIIVAVRQDMPGFGYRDPRTGDLSGLEIDLARAVAERIFGDPAKIRFRPVTAQRRIALLQSLQRFLDPVLKQYSILSTLLTSNWWHLGMAGKLPEFLCPKPCVGQQDFVGLDYYWGINSLRFDRVQRLIDSAAGHYDQAPVWPGALYNLLRYHAELFPNLPLLVIENGCVDATDGVDRATYIRQHVEQVRRAVRAGLNVQSYVCWSITSNREWGLPFGKGNDFGLYHIDLDTDRELKRVPTPAVSVYQEIIADGGIPAP